MRLRTFVLLLTTVALGFAGIPAHAEDPVATSVNTADAQDYLGSWKLTLEIMNRPFELILNIADVGGKIGATLDSARQPEALAISNIERTPEGKLDMNSELKFGGSFTININILVGLEGGGLVGRVKDQGGLFDAPVTGARVTAEELDAVQGRRPDPTEARANFGGQRVRIAFADLKKGTSDWKLFENVQDGQVYEFTLSRATKLYTDLDLKFGEVVVKKENVAKDYPGVYSLWLKKVGDGWNLVFNNQPDIWGTRHEAEFDAAEIPLRIAKADQPTEKMMVEIDQKPDGGTLRIRWDDTKWEADFNIVQ